MKSAQLQIRVTPAEKAEIERGARGAGLGMSEYVLAKVLPEGGARWRGLLRDIVRSGGERAALAALSSWLGSASPVELQPAVEAPPPAGIAAPLANTVAAMVEQACAARGVPAPRWTLDIEPLAQPVFGSTLSSLRLHLLTNSPAPFRRRNLFVDTAVGGQV